MADTGATLGSHGHFLPSNSSIAEKDSGNDDKASEEYDIDANGFTNSSLDQHGDVEQQKQKGSASEPRGQDPNIIGFDGPDDKMNPMNWTPLKKWGITASLSFMTFVVTFSSSVFSTAIVPTAEEFHVSQEVMILGTSLFVAGFAAGPIIWGPASELYGRKLPLFIAYSIFAIFNIPVAVAQNLETIFLARFFAGFFASAPLAICGGALADFHDPVNRGVAISAFSAATFIGPAMGPILGGFITMSYLGWRWPQWLTLIMAALVGSISLFTVPETFSPVILQRKARRLRYQTRNWAIRAPADEKEINVKELINKYLFKPFKILALEPILILITIYISLIYATEHHQKGILYGTFEGFPIAFQEVRGWNPGVGALPFLSVLVGVLFGCATIITFTKTRFRRIMIETGGPVPEERLIPMIAGGFIMPAGLFWFAWTSSPHITPWPQIVSCAFIGMGVNMIFMTGLTYIVDVYQMNANSALSANTVARSLVGAGFPMFATPMFLNLGVPWAMSLLAFLCVALFPVPILFYIYGKRIRKLSRYTAE